MSFQNLSTAILLVQGCIHFIFYQNCYTFSYKQCVDKIFFFHYLKNINFFTWNWKLYGMSYALRNSAQRKVSIPYPEALFAYPCSFYVLLIIKPRSFWTTKSACGTWMNNDAELDAHVWQVFLCSILSPLNSCSCSPFRFDCIFHAGGRGTFFFILYHIQTNVVLFRKISHYLSTFKF